MLNRERKQDKNPEWPLALATKESWLTPVSLILVESWGWEPESHWLKVCSKGLLLEDGGRLRIEKVCFKMGDP